MALLQFICVPAYFLYLWRGRGGPNNHFSTAPGVWDISGVESTLPEAAWLAANYPVISMGVPSFTSAHISSMSRLLTAIQPAVQSLTFPARGAVAGSLGRP
jgi:hypothetical protein